MGEHLSSQSPCFEHRCIAALLEVRLTRMIHNRKGSTKDRHQEKDGKKEWRLEKDIRESKRLAVCKIMSVSRFDRYLCL